MRYTSITVTEDSTRKEMKILLEQQPMVIHRVIVCWGTTCFRLKDLKKVVKLSWPSNLRPPEADLLRRARDHGVDGVAKLLGHRPITSIEELRDGLTLPDSDRFGSASCDASISFSESRSQATLSRSFDAFQAWKSPAAVWGNGSLQIRERETRLNAY